MEIRKGIGVSPGVVISTAVVLDETHVFGHCELDDPGKHDHPDPRFFDWTKLSMSNTTNMSATT